MMGKLVGIILGLAAWLFILPIAISDIMSEACHKAQRWLWEKRKGN